MKAILRINSGILKKNNTKCCFLTPHYGIKVFCIHSEVSFMRKGKRYINLHTHAWARIHMCVPPTHACTRARSYHPCTHTRVPMQPHHIRTLQSAVPDGWHGLPLARAGMFPRQDRATRVHLTPPKVPSHWQRPLTLRVSF